MLYNDENLELLQQVAEEGDAEAQNNLGDMSADERLLRAIFGTSDTTPLFLPYVESGIVVDEKAFERNKKAAEQGDAYAQSNLGLMYANGQGVEQDYAKAFEWWQKAAEQGDAYAQSNLGVMYEKGLGVEQDYAKAVEFYTKAAEQGNFLAQFCLSSMYKHGYGVEQDHDKAQELWQKSMEQVKSDTQND